MVNWQGKLYRPHMLPAIVSEDVRAAIEGMPCTLRLASFIGLRCSDQTTVVGCHTKCGVGGGQGTKTTDLGIAAGCHLCHDLLDMRHHGWKQLERYPAGVIERVFHGVMETQAMLVQLGIIQVRGATILHVI